MYKKTALFFGLTVISLVCSGCATVRHQVPQELVAQATVSGMPEARTFIGSEDSLLQRNLIASITEEGAQDYIGADGSKIYPLLAISGGSANGAYGAGLLKGWSQEGSRPKFKVVTGVSTGAITAPFAFLGKDYDDELEKLYTTMSTRDIMFFKGPLRALFGDSFGSNKPLEKKIKEIFTDEILKKIAIEHRAGRRLYVGTTNLDVGKFVVWDMGAIAARGDKKLFCDVIRASAAIPVLFPPVFISVKAGGRTYDEMHVDGGTIAQAFTVYRLLDPYAEKKKELGVGHIKIRARYYVIRNGYVEQGYGKVKDNLISIANRSSDTMINAQGVGDTYTIYTYMKKRGYEFYLAFIPSDYRPAKKEEFDRKQMKQLFDRGYQDALGGYDWHTAPPGMKE